MQCPETRMGRPPSTAKDWSTCRVSWFKNAISAGKPSNGSNPIVIARRKQIGPEHEVREGLKNSDLPPAQGCAGKINGAKPLIIGQVVNRACNQVVNRACNAASFDKASDGVDSEFPEGDPASYNGKVPSSPWGEDWTDGAMGRISTPRRLLYQFYWSITCSSSVKQ